MVFTWFIKQLYGTNPESNGGNLREVGGVFGEKALGNNILNKETGYLILRKGYFTSNNYDVPFKTCKNHRMLVSFH